MKEEYKERPNDHLVEPFLGGLGLDEGPRVEAPIPGSEAQPAQENWWRRWLRKLGLRKA